MEYSRDIVACLVGIGIRKSIAIFGNTYLCRGKRSTISCGAIGSGRTIRIGATTDVGDILVLLNEVVRFEGIQQESRVNAPPHDAQKAVATELGNLSDHLWLYKYE